MSGETNITELELRKMELEIRLRQIELPMKLARVGMRGLLIGGVVALVVFFGLALISVFSSQAHITGFELCIMAGILAAMFAVFGSFIFQRTLSIGAEWQDKKVSLGTGETARQAHVSEQERGAVRSGPSERPV